MHAVSFSPSGNSIAYCAHDSTITIANGPQQPLQVIQAQTLPFTTVFHVNEDALVVAGHDCSPYVVTRGDKWELSKIDGGRKSKVSANTARNMFMQMDSRNQQNADSELTTTHQNTITLARPYQQGGNSVVQFSTSGVDGQLVIWDLLNAGVAQLRL